jgi:phosphatidylserine/phosphatidylglycerophosphate/cardiolipin synthase-like enzyme
MAGSGSTPPSRRGTPIFAPAKILVMDDRLLRVGSSNPTNRSLGLDTECDLAVEAGREAAVFAENGLLDPDRPAPPVMVVATALIAVAVRAAAPSAGQSARRGG